MAQVQCTPPPRSGSCVTKKEANAAPTYPCMDAPNACFCSRGRPVHMHTASQAPFQNLHDSDRSQIVSILEALQTQEVLFSIAFKTAFYAHSNPGSHVPHYFNMHAPRS